MADFKNDLHVTCHMTVVLVLKLTFFSVIRVCWTYSPNLYMYFSITCYCTHTREQCQDVVGTAMGNTPNNLSASSSTACFCHHWKSARSRISCKACRSGKERQIQGRTFAKSKLRRAIFINCKKTKARCLIL